jgi:hypothetical protein
MDVKPNVDRLHAVITDARARKKAGYSGNDIWREDVLPSAATRARIIPLLQTERDRLKAQLEAVRALVVLLHSQNMKALLLLA